MAYRKKYTPRRYVKRRARTYRSARPSKIIVISNYRLSDCFPDHRDAEPLQRRFREIRFPDEHSEASMRADILLAELERVSSTTSNADTVDVDDSIDGILASSSGYEPDTEVQQQVVPTWNWSSRRPNIEVNDWLFE